MGKESADVAGEFMRLAQTEGPVLPKTMSGGTSKVADSGDLSL